MAKRPEAKNSEAERELDKAQEQFDIFEKEVKELTLDTLKAAPQADQEPQTKMSTKEIERSTDLYLKPWKTFPSKEKFNERFRDEYNFAKEYVHFTAENKEIPGDLIELDTKPYPGLPIEQWKVPTNKPVWGPRYLAERLRGCTYSKLMMNEGNHLEGDDRHVQWAGKMVVEKKVSRLTAEPVQTKKSIFMGANSF